MADQSTSVTQLIQGLQADYPNLYLALIKMTGQIQDLYFQLNPLVALSRASIAIVGQVDAPLDFSFVFTPTTVRLSWSAVDGAFQYEIRKGTDWDTASFVFRSVSLQGDIDALVYGAHTYLIKSVTASGIYSDDPTALVITIPTIPGVIINSQVIDNNILLYWNEPEAVFTIDFYEVFKNGVSLGTLDGTFFTRFETIAGTFTYRVIATDIAGNDSEISEVSVVVNTPPDFQLQDSRTTDFSGPKDSTIAFS